MTTVWDLNLFYPFLFLTIIVLIATIGLVITKCKDSTLFQNIFAKSSDNAKEVTIDTTNKMKDMHDNVIKVDFTQSHEKELHTIETKVERMEKQLQEISDGLTELTKRVIEIEKNK